jgi:hypothetical protein
MLQNCQDRCGAPVLISKLKATASSLSGTAGKQSRGGLGLRSVAVIRFGNEDQTKVPRNQVTPLLSVLK